MEIKVNLEQGKRNEREVREHIDKASATARKIAEQRGEGVIGHERVRDQIIKHAEKDHKEGKI